MTLTLRNRILLTLLPLLLLLAVLGSTGILLLYRLGNSINAILRENYDSVIAMGHLDEALERIDSSFQFAMAGRQDSAREQYARNWTAYREHLRTEQNNVTLPGEQQLVDELSSITEQYRSRGEAFYALSGSELEQRQQAYFGVSGLLELFHNIKRVSGEILRLNQNNMEEANREARRIALTSLIWFTSGLAIALVLALLSAWHTIRTILRPIQAMTDAAIEISAGNVDQLVPYLSGDELGQLAQAFNTMTRSLRDYRKSQSAQLLRAQRTSQATIDSFPDPVIVIDSDGYVEMANPAAGRMLGVVPKDKAPTADVWRPPEPLRLPLTDALEGRRDYLPEGFETTLLVSSNGRERALLPRILTIRDPYGSTLGAAVLLQDVTRLRLLDQVKSNLVATASHELKTPLTSIRLAVHLLLEEAVGPLTSKQTELILDARENCERLLAVINDLLDLARLEQGRRQFDIERVSPALLVKEGANSIRARAEDKGVEVLTEVASSLPAVAVDVSRLGIALGNLLDNALTHTDRGGRITLTAAAKGDSVVLSVADTGTGIAAEHLPHLFEKFYRVPGQSPGSGTGLGLAIVDEIVTAHGGAVSCQSEPGIGTTFSLTLPIATDGLTIGFAYAQGNGFDRPQAEEGPKRAP